MKHLLFGLLLCGGSCFGQTSFHSRVLNSATGEPLADVSVIVKGTGKGALTGEDGRAVIRNVPPGTHLVLFSMTGFSELGFELSFPRHADSILTVQLEPAGKEIETVTVSSARTDSRIENSPTRIEVIGLEEVEEESGVKPSNISWLLGDVAGIQAQQTSATTNNVELRIQGLRGNYTQVLRDGVPLFGGYAGGFSVLEIPPQDIRQIEIIKGPSSTLYGGDAIAGIINIISKKPVAGARERSILANINSRREANMNVYLSEKSRNIGYTFYGGGTYQTQIDVNKDGFTDIGRLEGIYIHPTFYYYPNEKNTVSIGLNTSREERHGGDLQVLSGNPDNSHQFYIRNESYRNTANLSWEHQPSATARFTLKGNVSAYRRNMMTNVFGMKARQISWYSEASYSKKFNRHHLVGGVNLNGERFRKQQPDSSLIGNYTHYTVGFFVQDVWRIHPKFLVEAGMRSDFHNRYGTFLLPRLSILVKPASWLRSRLTGGLGYRIPTQFEAEIDERDYKKIQPLSGLEAERSYGANWDVHFESEIGEVEFSVNQLLYFTHISRPVILEGTGATLTFRNANAPLVTRGLETWLQIGYEGLEAYLGYTFTDARKKYDALLPFVELSARHKFAAVVSHEFSERLRTCLEATFIGRQYLEDGRRSPAYSIISGMVQYNLGRFSVVLNCENVFDYRQTRKENIVIPPLNNPGFKSLWAPIDGRLVNISVKLRL